MNLLFLCKETGKTVDMKLDVGFCQQLDHVFMEHILVFKRKKKLYADVLGNNSISSVVFNLFPQTASSPPGGTTQNTGWRKHLVKLCSSGLTMMYETLSF